MSDTPRTDAQIASNKQWGDGVVKVDFARRLESDRAELIEILRHLFAAANDIRHGGHKDIFLAAYDGWAHETRALLARLEKE